MMAQGEEEWSTNCEFGVRQTEAVESVSVIS